MATQNPALSSPSTSTFTELWYAASEDSGLKQVFGVQAIPQIQTAAETITCRTLESDTEFALKGVRPYEAIEIEVLYYPEQHKELKALEATNVNPWWYVKLPDVSGGGKPLVVKWRGSLSVSLSEVALDDTLRNILTIGKSTEPVELDGLPSASAASYTLD